MLKIDHFFFYSSILLAYPFMFYLMLPISNKILILTILAIFVLFIFKHHNKLLYKKNNDIIILLIIQMIFFFLYGTITLDYASLNYVLQILTVLIFSIYFFKVRKNYTLYFSTIYIKIHIWMVIMATIGFFLILFGILNYVAIYPHGGTTGSIYNYLLTFTNGGARFVSGSIEFIRVAGYYDEPGAFAYYLIYAIIINRLTINNKKSEIILSVLGLFTFSLAFIVSLALLNYKYIIKKRNFLYLIIIIVLLVILYFNLSSEYTYFIDTVILERFEISDEGYIKGDNRTKAILEGFVVFLQKPLFGYGFDEIKNLGFDPSNIMGFLVSYGVIGIIFYFIHVIYMIFIALQYNFFKIGYMFFILLLNYIQRPGVMGLYNELLILLLILILKQKKSLTKFISKKDDANQNIVKGTG